MTRRSAAPETDRTRQAARQAVRPADRRYRRRIHVHRPRPAAGLSGDAAGGLQSVSPMAGPMSWCAASTSWARRLSRLTNIVATGDKQEIFNGYCGAESGSVPVSAVAPAILISEMEFAKKETLHGQAADPSAAGARSGSERATTVRKMSPRFCCSRCPVARRGSSAARSAAQIRRPRGCRRPFRPGETDKTLRAMHDEMERAPHAPGRFPASTSLSTSNTACSTSTFATSPRPSARSFQLHDDAQPLHECRRARGRLSSRQLEFHQRRRLPGLSRLRTGRWESIATTIRCARIYGSPPTRPTRRGHADVAQAGISPQPDEAARDRRFLAGHADRQKCDPRIEPDWTSRNWEEEARKASAVLREFSADLTARA